MNGHLWGLQNLNLSAGWHHIAVTYPAGGQSSAIKIYIDGVLQTAGTLGGSAQSVNTGSSIAQIGRNAAGTSYYGGDVDDVRIYDVQLSDAEVMNVFSPAPLQAAGELTETNLDGATVTLTLAGDVFAATVSDSHVSVAGLTGVSVSSVTRDSDTQLSVELGFDGTAFDEDTQLTFTVAAAALVGSSDSLTATLFWGSIIDYHLSGRDAPGKAQ